MGIFPQVKRCALYTSKYSLTNYQSSWNSMHVIHGWIFKWSFHFFFWKKEESHLSISNTFLTVPPSLAYSTDTNFPIFDFCIILFTNKSSISTKGSSLGYYMINIELLDWSGIDIAVNKKIYCFIYFCLSLCSGLMTTFVWVKFSYCRTFSEYFYDSLFFVFLHAVEKQYTLKYILFLKLFL